MTVLLISFKCIISSLESFSFNKTILLHKREPGTATVRGAGKYLQLREKSPLENFKLCIHMTKVLFQFCYEANLISFESNLHVVETAEEGR